MLVCLKELGDLHTTFKKRVLLCQKPHQILSAPNIKIFIIVRTLEN